jgi:hypothetical protein
MAVEVVITGVEQTDSEHVAIKRQCVLRLVGTFDDVLELLRDKRRLVGKVVYLRTGREDDPDAEQVLATHTLTGEYRGTVVDGKGIV